MLRQSKHIQLSRAALGDMDDPELEAASRLGGRRFRRWANDRILRDLAGKLTAEDMQGLFSPVPFGNPPKKSAMQRAAEPHVYAVWESFISIDMDKQNRVLQKWEEHVALQRKQGTSMARVPLEIQALNAWAGVSRKARNALRKAPFNTVENLEALILSQVQASSTSSADGAELRLPSSFHRLLAHGIAEYHGLVSLSRTDADGARVTYVRRKAGAGLHGPGGPRMQEQQAGGGIRLAEVLYLLADIAEGNHWPDVEEAAVVGVQDMAPEGTPKHIPDEAGRHEGWVLV